MPKEQYLITESERIRFDSLVNNKLGEGWRVVPGTLICSIALTSTSPAATYPGHTTPASITYWAVVLEKIT